MRLRRLEACPPPPCQLVPSEGTLWSSCSVSCGVGTVHRRREVVSGDFVNCTTVDEIEAEVCEASPCPTTTTSTTTTTTTTSTTTLDILEQLRQDKSNLEDNLEEQQKILTKLGEESDDAREVKEAAKAQLIQATENLNDAVESLNKTKEALESGQKLTKLLSDILAVGGRKKRSPEEVSKPTTCAELLSLVALRASAIENGTVEALKMAKAYASAIKEKPTPACSQDDRADVLAARSSVYGSQSSLWEVAKDKEDLVDSATEVVNNVTEAVAVASAAYERAEEALKDQIKVVESIMEEIKAIQQRIETLSTTTTTTGAATSSTTLSTTTTTTTSTTTTTTTMVTDDPATTAAYCAIDPRHTMCLYQGPSEECKKKTIARGMSEAVKAAMVAKHNELRRKVAQGNQPDQPPAANMRELVWDEELATSAQRWADQCTNSHDYAKQTLDGVYVGQNLYMTWGPSDKNQKELDDDSVRTIQNWFDEVE